jgi:histone H3/H4
MAGAKMPDVVARVAEALTNDAVRFSDHARRRVVERLYEYGLDEIDVFRILRKGVVKRRKMSGMLLEMSGTMRFAAKR